MKFEVLLLAATRRPSARMKRHHLSKHLATGSPHHGQMGELHGQPVHPVVWGPPFIHMFVGPWKGHASCLQPW